MSRVYIGNLPSRASERDVERFFKNYGRLRDVFLKSGYGFVEFDDYKDADDAVYDLNGKDLAGSRVIIEHARLPPGGRGDGRARDIRRDRDRDRGSRFGPPLRTDNRVVVENLSSRVSWQDLKDLMRKAGEVTFADAHQGRRNEGIVEFSSYSDMKCCIDKFENYELHGRRLKVREDKGGRRRSRSSRSRSRSRSRSKSRSRSRGRRRSRSHSRRSRSRSDKKRDSRSRSRSKSRSRSAKKQKYRSRSRSRGHDSRSASRTKSEEKHSRTPSPVDDKPVTNGADDEIVKDSDREKSASRSRSKSPSRSRDSHSRSRSPDNGHAVEDDADEDNRDEASPARDEDDHEPETVNDDEEED